VPAHTHALAGFPLGHIRANRVHHTHDLMPRHARILDPREKSVLGHRITVADAAGLHLDPHLARPGRWDFTFDKFKSPAGAGNLGSTHFWHNNKYGLVV